MTNKKQNIDWTTRISIAIAFVLGAYMKVPYDWILLTITAMTLLKINDKLK